ncbi:hypothetical protein [Pseudomonas sp.]|uniref:hypothetical protein n=1 Tax=Pseudomonas sp. TaxID=306 RepID=UPI003A96C9F6
MKKVLLLGASGFIGQGVYKILRQEQDLRVTRHSRSPKAGFAVCEVGSTAFIELVKDHDFSGRADPSLMPSMPANAGKPAASVS